MAEIGPGTPLICVTTGEDDTCRGQSGLTEGALYFCDEVHPGALCGCDMCGDGTIRVHIIDKNFWCYCICQFRPLNDGLEVKEEEKELANV